MGNEDVATYIRYCNLERVHAAKGGQSPINDEKYLKKMSGLTSTHINIIKNTNI